MSILTLDNVAIGYHRQAIIEGINLHLPEGEMTCLLGANGCGKTTLMKTLLGLLPAIDGDIYLQGQSINRLKQRDIAKVIAYVPQAHDTPFTFSVVDMVMMGLTPISLRSAYRGKRKSQCHGAIDPIWYCSPCRALV